VPVTEVFFLVGTFGLVLTLFLLFVRFFPMIAISEVKGVMPQANPHWEGYTQHHGGNGAAAPAVPAAAPAAATAGGH
jgi:molybdopterin-containing oxidoreductase family membrane subunit